jgi:hypothetical protein
MTRHHAIVALGPAWLGLVTSLAVTRLAAAVEPLPDQPISLVLALDTSGSLRPEDHAERTRVVEGVLASLPSGSPVAVFGFNDVSELLLPWTTDRARALEVTARLGAAGHFTSLHDAIFDASRYQSEAAGPRRAILLVSDGFDENSALTLEDGVGMARELGIPVFTIGLGRVRAQVLRRIAKLTDGEYFGPGATGAEVGRRVGELTLSRPVPATAEPATAVEEAAPEAEAPSEALAGGVFWAGWLLAAVLGLGSLAAFVLALRRREPARSPEAPAWEAVAPANDSGTLVTRLEGVGDTDSPTMVLTLKPLLHVTRGPDAGRLFEVSLDSAVSIGRAPGNDVVLSDPAVSSQHCRVRPAREGGFEVFDLNSTNGTWINERRVGRHALSAGDSIKLGESVLQFRMDHLKGGGTPD